MKTHQSTFQAQTIFYLINYIWLIIQRVQNTFVHLYFERSLLHWTSTTCSPHFPRKILLFEFFLSAGAQEETDKSIPSIVAARVGTKPSIFSLRPQGLSMDQPLSLPPQTRIVVTNRDIPLHPRPRNERVRIQKPVYPTEEIWLRVAHGEEERGVKRKSTMVKLKHGCRWKTDVQLRDLSKTVDSMGGYIMGRVCFVVSDYHFTLFVLV